MRPLRPEAFAPPDIFLQHIGVRGLVARTDGHAMAAHCLTAKCWGGKEGTEWTDSWIDCG